MPTLILTNVERDLAKLNAWIKQREDYERTNQVAIKSIKRDRLELLKKLTVSGALDVSGDTTFTGSVILPTRVGVTSNALRGLFQDNTTNSHTGDSIETDLASFTLKGGTLDTAGGLYMLASGTTAGTAGSKTVRFKFGSGLLEPALVIPAANTDDWTIEVWLFNTSTTAQRYVSKMGRAPGATGAVTLTGNLFGTEAEDTKADVIVKATGQLGNTGDTVSQAIFDIFLVHF